MIVVIDYGYGNIFSIVSAFKEIGYSCLVSDKKRYFRFFYNSITRSRCFSTSYEILGKKNLDRIIIDAVKNNKSIIGICLGYQMLFDKSNEFGIHKGLGLITGEVKSLDLFKGSIGKIPNVGWRPLIINKENALISKNNEKQMFYFVHSFVPVAKHENQISSFINFNNNKIHASVHHKNIVGFQFHPEKVEK